MHEPRHLSLGIAIAAGLSMAACAVTNDAPVGQTSDHPMYPLATAITHSTSTNARASLLSAPIAPGHASIHTPIGKRLWMAAKADMGATNAWLASRGERFVAANPEGIPNPYWGLDPTRNAYIFVAASQYSDSRWELDGVRRNGRYAVADLTVFGFQTDANGTRLDITGDGIVDDADWTGLEVSTTLSGTNPIDTAVLVGFERGVFGAHADGASVSVAGVDADGYPNRARIGDGPRQIALEIGENNANRCTPDNVEWQRCYYFGDIEGSFLTIYPGGRVEEWTYANNRPNWVRFDSTTDTFSVGDPQLAAQLHSLDFAPLYWVRSPEYKADYDSRGQH